MLQKLFIEVPEEEVLKKLRTGSLMEDGRELLNPLKMEIDVTPRPPTIQEQIKRLLKYELSRKAESQGMETFEDADDFHVDDEFDLDEMLSGYEYADMIDEYPIETSLEDGNITEDRPQVSESGEVVTKPDGETQAATGSTGETE